MFWIEMLFALIFAVLAAAVLVWGFRRRGTSPLAGWLFFFMIIFLGVWALGAWMRPVGPETLYWGAGDAAVSWLGFFILAILFLLILATVTPKAPAEPAAPPAGDMPVSKPSPGSTGAALGFGLIFWLLIVLFGLGILAAYLWRPAMVID